MKLLLVTESYWPNYDGGALFERRLVQALNAEGYPTSVWAPGKKLHSYEETDETYTIYREKSIIFAFNTNYRVSYFPFLNARRVIKKTKPDVIHIHTASGMGLAALIWAKVHKIPVVATNHFMPENAILNLPLTRGLSRFVAKAIWKWLVWFHNQADFVTSPTESAVSMLQRRGLAVPARALTNGVDADLFTPQAADPAILKKYEIPEGKRALLHLGRLDGEKRIDILINAFARAESIHENVQLVIAGKGKEAEKLYAQAERCGVARHVTFTGFVEEADKPALYQSVDGFIITSPAELQSIVTLEALASGLPVIAVDIGALAELCHDGKNGYLAHELDEDEIAELIIRLFEDGDSYEEFARYSRQLVESEHRHQRMVKGFIEIYEQVAR